MPSTSITPTASNSTSGRRKSSPPPSASRGGAPSSRNEPVTTTTAGAGGGSFLTKYFLVILFLFACLSLLLNSRFINYDSDDISILEEHLEHHSVRMKKKSKGRKVKDDAKVDDANEDADADGDDANVVDNDANANNPHSHRISGLTCDKWGGPSPEAAQEMVYWEDIPSDAQYVSPFHTKRQIGTGKAKVKQDITQYMTFESDQGGWNNIRMAMETVLVRTE
jgi:hypothetical protein